MLLNNRIIWSDNGVLKDLSIGLSDYNAGTEVIPFVAAEDSLYFGSDMPFNHRFFDVTVVNALASSVSIKVWDGTTFNSAVDVLDQTQATAGKSLSKSGIISWVPDRNKTWARASTTESVTGLTTLKIYELYWVKLNFSADLTPATALNYIGHKFCLDDQLFGLYPELALSTILDAFKTGKTDWEEQEILASEVIVRDLRFKRLLFSPNQILEWERFQEPCVHKSAELIFSSFGQDYEDDRDRARTYYKESLDTQRGGIDNDADARLDIREKFTTTGFRRR